MYERLDPSRVFTPLVNILVALAWSWEGNRAASARSSSSTPDARHRAGTHAISIALYIDTYNVGCREKEKSLVLLSL